MKKANTELANAFLDLLCRNQIPEQKRDFLKYYESMSRTIDSQELMAAVWWLLGNGYARQRTFRQYKLYATNEGKEYSQSHPATYDLSRMLEKSRPPEKSYAEEIRDLVAIATMRQVEKRDRKSKYGKEPGRAERPVVQDPY